MGDEMNEHEEGADTRRDALKKLGLGAGVAWTAPVAMSFFSQAGAATPGSPPPSSTTTTSLPPVIPGCEAATCNTFVTCSSSNTDCICLSTPQGGFCMPGSTTCSSLSNCGANLECPPGFVCAVDTCCGDPVCVPISLVEQCPPSNDNDGLAASLGRVSTGAGTLGG